VAEALWELSGQYDVGVWYEYVRAGKWINQYDVFCGVVVNGVKLYQPHCRSVEDCVRQILEDYKREVEKMKEPPQPALVIRSDLAEELLKEWPELEAFGVDWIRVWAPHAREELVEIAKVMRRYPWMVDMIRQRPVGNPHPYMVEVYVAVDRSEVCLSLNQLRTFCARGGAVKEVKLELEFSRYEVYEEKIRGGVPPQGTAGIRRGGEGVRRDTLSAQPFLSNPPSPAFLNCFFFQAEAAGTTPASIREAAKRNSQKD
jgi:hypothetical protein